jgi:hypothetical protein
MINKLTNAFREITKLPFIKKQKGNTFDANVREILREEAGLDELDTPDNKLRTQQYAAWDTNKEYGLVSQPFGSQMPPDILIFLKGMGRLSIEIKRSNTGLVMWNSGHPARETIYVYNGPSKPRGTDTTYLLGSELITASDDTMFSDVKQFCSENTKRFTSPNFKLNFLRPMFEEIGKAKWLEHPERMKREAAVILYIQNKFVDRKQNR